MRIWNSLPHFLLLFGSEWLGVWMGWCACCDFRCAFAAVAAAAICWKFINQRRIWLATGKMANWQTGQVANWQSGNWILRGCAAGHSVGNLWGRWRSEAFGHPLHFALHTHSRTLARRVLGRIVGPVWKPLAPGRCVCVCVCVSASVRVVDFSGLATWPPDKSVKWAWQILVYSVERLPDYTLDCFRPRPLLVLPNGDLLASVSSEVIMNSGAFVFTAECWRGILFCSVQFCCVVLYCQLRRFA